MKIFRIVCTLLLWLILFGTCAAAYFLHPDAGWTLVGGSVIGFAMILAASLIINSVFD